MTNPAGTQVRATVGGLARYLWLLWILWLSFLIYPLSTLNGAHPSPLRLALVLPAVAVFAVVYSWNIWRNLRRVINGQEPASPWITIAVLVALGLALTLGDRWQWIQLFIYVGVSMGPSLPTRQAVRAVAVVVLLMLVLGLAIRAGIGPTAQIALQAAVSGFAVIIVVRTVVIDRELRLAREEIARLAVSEERLRFARDLHDLLGHSLSLIALKSELAGRLAAVAPERAAVEMCDVESVARTALQEVREAVAGYRQPTLASELQSAREILTAAGIAHQVDDQTPSLPAASEAALSWAVREGVTNVIRHSRAQRCTIRLTRESGQIGVEVTDDGRGGEPDAAASMLSGGRSGAGLAGLAERVAALGGRYEAGPRPGGGFRLAVSVPEPTGRRAPSGEHRDSISGERISPEPAEHDVDTARPV
jgi:two-component system sensor histidine kinase DesK